MKKDKPVRDAFALSLSGMRTIASFAPAPAIAHDKLHQKPVVQAYGSRNIIWRLFSPRRSRVV